MRPQSKHEPKNCKTWVDFINENEDIEKFEYPVPNTGNTGISTDSRQSDVFIGDLKNWNLLD